MNPAIGRALAAAAAWWSAAAAGAAPHLLVAHESASASGASPWLLRADGAQVSVARPPGEAISLPLPAGADVAAFVPLATGWLLAATVPRRDGRDLALWRHGEPEPLALPALPPRRAAIRHDPQPLVARGRLTGLAWLEGDALNRLAVWVASWDGRSWRELTRVAPPGPGSQLALTGTVLGDGSWLLAWSAFDGDDDEVLWSVRRGRSWSAPAALPGGDGVPDVTPALRADGGGALLAWSRFDGNDYRLVTSRLAAGSWSAPRWLAGAGTSFPSWEGPALLFRDSRHGAWVGAAIEEGRLVPLVARPGPPEPRPALLHQQGEWRLLQPTAAAPEP